ncbi:hypothetical protein DPMN_089586 [Dreissena polymorpha]|uniref:Uncharacterized protein n=1 Tax=Dreissena polymorpha TaxID=45954 RepID=A0A9D4KW85_DREPO|nr:hypothetical protein DPMN_089586 [Dreissena polymorpha]
MSTHNVCQRAHLTSAWPNGILGFGRSAAKCVCLIAKNVVCVDMILREVTTIRKGK